MSHTAPIVGMSAALLAFAPTRALASEPTSISIAAPGDSDAPSGPATPKDGVGMIVGGSMSLGFAGLITALEVRSALTGQQWVGGLVLAGGVMATGAVLLGVGVQRHRKYRSYVADAGLQPPRQGHGLVTGGAMSMGAGVILTIAGGVGYALINSPEVARESLHPQAEQRMWTVLGVGAGSLVSGAVMVGVGAHRNRQWRRWRPDQRARVELSPSFAAGREGAVVGLSGRF